jgi:hypothetical protein
VTDSSRNRGPFRRIEQPARLVIGCRLSAQDARPAAAGREEISPLDAPGSHSVPAQSRRRVRPFGFRTYQDYLDALWRERVLELRAFKKRFGHSRVPGEWHENRPLGGWVRRQRRLHRLNDLRDDRRKALESLGFEFDLDAPVMVPWETRYQELARFQRRFGHCRILRRRVESSSLANWVRTQRYAFHQGKLARGRIRALQALGFEWRLEERIPWEKSFERLCVYRQRHGHCNVSRRDGDARLLHWVSGQRMLFQRGALSEERQRKLERVGFRFRVQGAPRPFEEGLEQLRRFRRRAGMEISWRRIGEQDPSLANWFGNLQRSHREGRLDSRQIAQLEALGVRLNVREAKWETQFQRLIVFRKRHGHAHVPALWEGDPVLARWVVKQRVSARTGKMAPKRRARLRELGFFEPFDREGR